MIGNGWLWELAGARRGVKYPIGVPSGLGFRENLTSVICNAVQQSNLVANALQEGDAFDSVRCDVKLYDNHGV